MSNSIGQNLLHQSLLAPTVLIEHQSRSNSSPCIVGNTTLLQPQATSQIRKSHLYTKFRLNVPKTRSPMGTNRLVSVIPQAVLATDSPSELAGKYNLEGNTELQVNVRGPGPGSLSQLEIQVTNSSDSLVFHWGGIRDKKGKWVLPARQPQGTKVYKNRALRTPFTKSGSNSFLIIEIDDPAIQAIEFLIFDEAQNKWFKHNGDNFHVKLSSDEKLISNVSIPEDLVQIQAYLRWEKNGKQMYTPEQEKEEYEAARNELLEEISRGSSIQDLRTMLANKNYASGSNEPLLSEKISQVPDDLVQTQAYIRWEKAGKPNYSPDQQLREFEEARKELQLELEKGISLDAIQKKITKGEIQTKISKLVDKKIPFTVERIQRKKRDLMQLLNKYTPGPGPVKETISTKPHTLSTMDLFAKAKEEQSGGPILRKNIYKLADKELLVLVTKPSRKTRIDMATDFQDPLTLHWALSKNSGEWLAPPPSALPSGSIVLDSAVQTQFSSNTADDLNYKVQSIRIETEDDNFVGMPFVLLSGANWIKNNGSDFYVNFGGERKQVQKDAGDGKGTAKPLLDKIAKMESEAQKSFMHRFNIAADLMEEAKDAGEVGLAGILVWMRFMATRQLIWNKNYNVKPREISKAQDRLTDLLQNVYRSHPQYRELLRMIMSTVGRGGEGDVGQRIRDEILVLQRNNDCKGAMMEEWHQKLHNNTSPDDVVICQALIDYIKADFDIRIYWKTLNENGITKERLLSYDRGIHSEPNFRRDQKDSLLRDLGSYMRTLKAVHSGADLESAISNCMGYKSEGQGFMVGVHINPVSGLPSGFPELLQFVLAHVEDKNVEALLEGILEVREELRPLLSKPNDRLKDLLFLDIALDSTVRTAVERGYEELNSATPEKVIYFITLLLENLALSSYDNEDLIYCLKGWNQAISMLKGGDNHWALFSKSVLDRTRLALTSKAEWYHRRLQPSAEYLGARLGVEEWAVNIFTEEIIRAGSAASLSALLNRLDPTLRKTANLGSWQVISPVEAVGYVLVVDELISVQNKTYGQPTILVAKSVKGEEEIPDGTCKSPFPGCGFEFQRFGSSNFFETSSSEWESIPVDNFPFVTINNAGSLLNLESSLIYAIPEWRKVLKLRDRKIRSPRYCFRKGFKQLNAQPLKSTFGTDVLPTLESNDGTDLFAVDLTFSSSRVHLHDSTCIVGTITVPTSKSSVVIYEDCFDILFSSEGLTLSSSWCTQILCDFLWGPLIPNLSPILNMRIRKGSNGSLGSLFELSFSVQHVSCILPPEYLAILIGYFSLADWKPNAKQQPVTETFGYMDTETNNAITYKFEVLDSTLFSPVGNVDYELLKLDIQQFYCTYIENCTSENILKDIPIECLVPAHKVLDKNHCLNIFGRDLSLALLFLKDDASDSLMFNQNSGQRISTLIAPLSADVWIRIPCECVPSYAGSSPPTCIMVKVYDCQLIVDGSHVIVGYEALLDVINQFSSVYAESQGFTSDVLQFLQLKRSLTENNELPAEYSSVNLTEIRCSVHSISIKLYTSRSESTTSKLVAKAQMQVQCYSSLRIDEPHCLDISFSSVSLFSLVSSVMLVECTSSCSSSSVIEIKISTAELGEIETHVSLPFVDIWLYLLDWSEVIDLFSSYSPQISKTKSENASSKKSIRGPIDQSENGTVDVSNYSSQSQSMSSKLASQNMKPDHVFLYLKSENISMTVHIPVRVSCEAFGVFAEPQAHMDSFDILEKNQYGFVAVALESRCTELVSNGKTARLKCTVEKTKGTVELCKEMSIQAQPFFKFLHLNLEAEICSNQVDHVQVKAEVRCDSLDVWLSYHIFYFWRCVLLEVPARGSSEFAFSRIDLTINLRKLSLLLIDGKRCSNGPLLEVLMRNSLLCAKFDENKIEASITSDLQLNYNNIHKVLWEPFLEPWMFKLILNRWDEKNALLNSAPMTDIHLTSTSQLNLNLTESLVEVVFRAVDLIADAWGLMELTGLSKSPRYSKNQISDNLYNGRYAPYILQNLTSLPLAFHVCEGPVSSDDSDLSALKDEIIVQPGSSIPIYIDETPEEQLFRYRPSHSSERLSDKQFMDTAHRYIIIRLEGTSIPSTPISMDLVGLSCFEMDFSKSSKSLEVHNVAEDLKTNFIGKNKAESDSGYVVPVVVDVSVQRYTKLIRLYSTVVLLNATSTPFEVRFDIPFGVSPKMLDPVYPGQEFPLPLHLAEAGRMRWRPLGNAYLWSEAYNISNIIAHENGIGFLRSVICYPSHPSSDPFRFCISVHDMCLPAFGRPKGGASIYSINTVNQSVENSHQVVQGMDESKKRFLHLVTLSSPLVVNNYLPLAVTLAIESGGVTRSALLSEVETSFFHIDSSHDLAMVFTMHGFVPSILKFPRAETFGSMAKFSGTKFSVSETVVFDSDLSGGPLYVTVEKIMDAVSGAREICISVPFLLYNCTGFPLIVSNCVNDMKGWGCIVPSCYNLEEDLLPVKKDGLGLLSSNQDFRTASHNDSLRNSSMDNHIVSIRKNVESHPSKYLCKPLNLSAASSALCGSPDKLELNAKETSASNLTNLSSSSSQSNLKSPDYVEIDHNKVSGCMYSPDPNSSSSDIKVQLSRGQSECHSESTENCFWSSPFFLVPSAGSTSVLVPQPSKNAGYIVSVTSSTVSGPISGRTRIITFQPRYVISNACSKDLYYKQKGTDSVSHLRIGQHSQIHFADTARELLVSVHFDEPAWQWSGCFLPEHLGDTQLKMRNYISDAVTMIRVEVQNADVSTRDEKIVGSSNGNSGTNLILLSDDDTGFMPYRIDNFSKERLRIYQQRCETFETIVHAYTSCPYAWDEPCFPHRLIVEVPGERVVGSYALDDVKEYAPVYLTATSEKPERTLFVYVQAEGVVKVLSIVDSTCHHLNDLKGPHVTKSKEKRKEDQKQETSAQYKDKISFSISFIGISVMNSYPQELLYASAKNTTIDLVRSMDQETFSLQMSSLQIDNQLHSTPYPVILSFEHENRSNTVGQVRNRDDNTRFISESELQIADSLCDPVFTLAAAKWRNTDTSLVSFEYISLKVADFHLELEQEVILSLFDFYKTISSRFDSSILPDRVSMLRLSSDFGLAEVSSTYTQAHEVLKTNGDQLYASNIPKLIDNRKNSSLFPSVLPIGAPWQHIYLLARKQKKIYVELFDLAPINLTLSFSSSPWMLRNGVLTSGESVIHRGLMALADIEGAQIHLKQLVIAHQLASWESIQVILIRHYNRQFLHEMYKVFGSAGVIGNPMGFARSVGLGIRDFLSVPARSLVKNPAGLFIGMAQGTTSLLSNTVYAISDAATQFSRAAHKGIVAFTFDDQSVAKMEKQQFGVSSHSKSVINEFLEGLTGLLQSPVKGAEKHGLPGVLSGIALGVTGLVARPAASILEVTGKTAQSIRNRSKLHMGSQRFRVRLPRPLSRELPLRPYSWEEAVGSSVLSEAGDGLKLKDEMLVMCKTLKQGGKFVIITERLVLIVGCSNLVDLGKPRFRGIPADPGWVIEAEIGMDSVIHASADMVVVHILGSGSDTLSRQNQQQHKRSGGKTPIPFFQTDVDFTCNEEAENFLQVLLSTIKKGKERGWGAVYLLHQSNLK